MWNDIYLNWNLKRFFKIKWCPWERLKLGNAEVKVLEKYPKPSLNNDMAGQYQTQASHLFELQRQGGLDRKEKK